MEVLSAFAILSMKEVFENANICQLCKNEIHAFEDTTLDYILPYSKGGKTVRENGQLAHRGCNARKNAEVPRAPGRGETA
jgi:5-methylcytosine-specific restriction endonuclease McrA